MFHHKKGHLQNITHSEVDFDMRTSGLLRQDLNDWDRFGRVTVNEALKIIELSIHPT